MSLRLKYIAYLIGLHAILAALSIHLFLANRMLLFAIEAFFLISFVLGIVLIRRLFLPLETIRGGAETMKERDFSTKFRKTGQPEMDRLVDIYNTMIDALREERLKFEEKNYFVEKVIYASPAGIIVFDLNEKIDMLNGVASRLLKKPAASLKGKRLAESGGKLSAELTTLKEGEPRLIAVEGGRKLKCLKASFMDRGFKRHFVLMDEVTEELRRSEKAAYEKIIRIMAHEVNNSIGASNSLLHSCLSYKEQIKPGDREHFETALSVAISRSDHLNSFMKSFADVIRLPDPRKETQNIRLLAEGVLRLMKPMMDARRISSMLTATEEDIWVALDRSQMEQVLVNLIKNSIEAMDREGAITVRTGSRNGKPLLEIEDTGRGIEPGKIHEVFEPFYSTKEDGHGIGLTMVQEILHKHGFGYSMDSREGGPTVFTIFFSSRTPFQNSQYLLHRTKAARVFPPAVPAGDRGKTDQHACTDAADSSPMKKYFYPM